MTLETQIHDTSVEAILDKDKIIIRSVIEPKGLGVAELGVGSMLTAGGELFRSEAARH